jgi:hypothetical protein
MGLPLYLSIPGGILRTSRGDARLAISSMTIGATQANGAGDVHGGTVGCSMASQATGRLSVGVGLRLEQQNIFVALRRSGTVSTDREREAKQGRRSENTNDIVKCRSHVPSGAFKTEISH